MRRVEDTYILFSQYLLCDTLEAIFMHAPYIRNSPRKRMSRCLISLMFIESRIRSVIISDRAYFVSLICLDTFFGLARFCHFYKKLFSYHDLSRKNIKFYTFNFLSYFVNFLI